MRSVPGKSSTYSRRTPPFTARGSPIRSKLVLVSHPSPVNPLPPCSAGTDGSAPASTSERRDTRSCRSRPARSAWRRLAPPLLARLRLASAA